MTARGGILFVSVGLSLAACAVGPNFARPAPPPVVRYDSGAEPGTTVSADGKTQHFQKGAAVAEDWWQLFNSIPLNTAMTDALANNQNLQAAQASLRRSQDTLRAGYGVFFPQVDGTASAERQLFSGKRLGIPITSIFNLFTLSAAVSYTLDVFGGERRALENLQAQAEGQRYALAATYLSLTGNLVNTVIAQAAYRAQIAATERLVALEQDQFQITRVQAQAGTTPYVNVLAIQTQLTALKSTVPPLRQKLDQAQHLLATLAGHYPADWKPIEVALAQLSLPADVPLSLPSELVRQRPDILAAEATLHSASAEIGVATAALLPNFTLNGTLGTNSNTLANLFSPASLFWSFGAGLTQPLFHGGTLWFQRQAAIDAFDQSLSSYRQTVLAAFAQVADTLRAIEHDAEAVRAESEQLEAATGQVKLVEENYQAGLVNYVQVIIANAQYHQAMVGQIEAQAQRLQDTVALYVALGGGWWKNKKAIQ